MPGVLDPRRALDALLATAAAGSLIGLLAATWSGLWREPPNGQLAIVATVSVLPALVRVLAGRNAAWWACLSAAAAAIVALSASVGSGPIALLRGDGEAWGALGDVLPDGLGNASTTPLPLAVDRAPALSALLVLVLAGLACLIAWQVIVSRRPLAGIVAAATGLAYRWTLVPPERPVLTGLLTLVIALCVFRLAGPRRVSRANSGRTALAGGVIVALALVGSVGADRAPASWWDWRDWTFGARQGPTGLSLKQGYGPLTYPDEPVLVARVEAEEPLPLRAVALEAFDGTSFVPSSSEVTQGTTRGRVRLVPDTQGGPRTVTQKITMGNARTPWLLAGGRPSEVAGLGRRNVTVFSDGAVGIRPSLAGDTVYTVTTLVPDPGPGALRQAGPYKDVDPDLLSMVPGQGGDEVTVAPWDSESGAARRDPNDFRQYAQVYALSRRIIGNARTPYAAVNRIEAYLRKLEYSDTVPRPIGNPDLVDFLLVSERGYCQHFAGAMALMLRMNGIPARVAVGFTSDPGRFDPDKKSYEIIDRDAHSWVEVHFPGYGWIPFDPTPGRSVPNSASVSSASFSQDGVDLGIDEAPEIAPATPGPTRDPSVGEPTFDDPGAAAGADSGPGPWLWALPGVLLIAFLTPLTAKAVRRARRRRGDERARVIGAARELESLLRDLGHPPDPSATTAERARTSWRDLGIDAAGIYGLASAARFDPSPPRTGSGDEAWRAFRSARRTVGWRRRMRAGLRLRSLRE